MLYVGHAVMSHKKWRSGTVKEVRLTNEGTGLPGLVIPGFSLGL